MTTTRSWKRGVVVMAVLVFGGGAGAIWAQTKPDEAGGSLAALTTEVRQLRLAVEAAARSQAQTQGLGVYLSAQQSRMVQLSARLDAVRSELYGATARSRELLGMLTAAQKEMTQVTDPEEREQAVGMMQMFKGQADRAAQAEADLRKRESDLIQALQLEESRWAELITRLEQMIKK